MRDRLNGHKLPRVLSALRLSKKWLHTMLCSPARTQINGSKHKTQSCLQTYTPNSSSVFDDLELAVRLCVACPRQPLNQNLGLRIAQLPCHSEPKRLKPKAAKDGRHPGHAPAWVARQNQMYRTHLRTAWVEMGCVRERSLPNDGGWGSSGPSIGLNSRVSFSAVVVDQKSLRSRMIWARGQDQHSARV